MIDLPKDCYANGVCTLTFVAVVNVMIHCTGLPSRTMAFISQLLGMLVANFSQLSSSLRVTLNQGCLAQAQPSFPGFTPIP